MPTRQRIEYRMGWMEQGNCKFNSALGDLLTDDRSAKAREQGRMLACDVCNVLNECIGYGLEDPKEKSRTGWGGLSSKEREDLPEEKKILARAAIKRYAKNLTN